MFVPRTTDSQPHTVEENALCYVTPEELVDEDQYHNHDENAIPECPHLMITIGDDTTAVAALVDSGAELSCVQKEYLEALVSNGVQLPEIPVTNVNIITALGSRSKRISTQVLLPIECQGKKMEVTALVVPRLLKYVILGQDWIAKNQVTISCHRFLRPLINSEEEVLHLRDGRPIYVVVSGEQTEGDHGTSIDEHFITAASQNMVTAISRERAGMEKGEVPLTALGDEGCPLQGAVATSVARRELTPQQQQQLDAVMKEHECVFSEVPGKTHVYTHRLEVTDDSPFCGKSYPVPHAHREAVQRAIDNMLKMDVIERSDTIYVNPLVVVSKKMGLEPRVCVDARALNVRLKPAYERPERMNDLLRRFNGKTWLSSIDLTSGYWQVPLAKEDRKYTGFGFRGMVYQFKRVPFGVKTASAAFIRALHLALGSDVLDYAVIYIDDIVVFSETFDQHLKDIASVLSKLKAAGMTVRRAKSVFCREEVKFLGHRVTSEGLSPDPDKIEVIKQFPTPRTQRQLRSFLGLSNFFRQHVPSYARIMEDLRGLLSTKKKWCWTPEADVAFKNLKKAFENRVMLSQPDFTLPFVVETDASLAGVAGVLYQMIGEERKIISIVSRGLSSAETRFSISEIELLSILFSVTKFREYILGQEVTVITDHKALQFLRSSKLTSSRLSRWSLLLQEYHLNIIYRPGVENYFCDFLSRNPMGQVASTEPRSKGVLVGVAKIAMDPDVRKRLKNIRQVQHDHSKEQSWYSQLQSPANEGNSSNSSRYYINDGYIYHSDGQGRKRVWIPPPLVNDIIWSYHYDLGHFGAAKCQHAISRDFWWRGMSREIRHVIATCERCQRSKYPRYNLQGKWNNVLPQSRGELVLCDYLGPLPKAKGGYQYVFVIVDGFTKYVRFYPLKRATTKMTLRWFLEDYCVEFGKPTRILSDNGSQFSSPVWTDTLAEHGIKASKISVRHPQGNAAERIMFRLGQAFRTYCHAKHVTWIDWLPLIERMTNIAVHDCTGFTPYELQTGGVPQYTVPQLLGLPLPEPIDSEWQVRVVRERMRRAGIERGKQQKGIRVEIFAKDEAVLLRVPGVSNAAQKIIGKLCDIFQGPFYIEERVRDNTYRLRNADGTQKGTFNVRSLRRYRQLRPIQDTDPNQGAEELD